MRRDKLRGRNRDQHYLDHKLRQFVDASIAGAYVTLNSVSCVSLGATTCYAVGRVGGTNANEVFVSSNGGISWSAVSAGDPIGSDRNLNGVSCQVALESVRPPSFVDLCFAVGDQGAIVTNSSSGRTWTSQQTNVEPNTLANSIFSGVSCPTRGTCFAVGEGPGIVASTNGTTWTQKYSGLGGQAISCPSTTTCFAVGTNSILANKRWHELDSSVPRGRYFVGSGGSKLPEHKHLLCRRHLDL